MLFTQLLSLASSISLASAQVKGFNYGSTLTDGSAKSSSVFEGEFNAAKALPGTNGFTSARLYTMIQAGTASDTISAIQAAIDTQTTLLLGLWASGGQTVFSNEITALKSAIATHGSAFTNLVEGISVGSEDLYRISVTGLSNDPNGVGAGPSVLVDYINQLRQALAGTALSNAKITHVDTFDVWTNSSNSAVIQAVDFVSMDAYPYFQKTMVNTIDNGASLFESAYQQTVSVSQGKDVWVTETGWPVSGDNFGQAVASVANAKTYWDEIGCGFLFGKINTYWYILQDAVPTLPSPSFGLVGVGSVSQSPLFDLTCPANAANLAAAAGTSSSSSASSSAASSSSTSSSSSSSSSGSSSGGAIVGAQSTQGSSSSSPALSSSSSSSSRAASSARPVPGTSSAARSTQTTTAIVSTTGSSSSARATSTTAPISTSSGSALQLSLCVMILSLLAYVH